MKLYLKTKDYSVSQESFALYHDMEMDMLVTKPQPSALDKYYESNAYISHTDSKKSLTDKLYQLVKRYSLSKKVALINSFSNEEKTILDIGAGTGDFLLTAQKSKWTICGVEPNGGAREKAKEKGIVLQPSLDQVSDVKFNVITLWHVLEHLPDLDDQIKKITALLNDRGTLIVAVPNFKSYDAKHYGEFWAAYDVPRHLWHFSKQAIEKLFGKYGMKLFDCKPMLFDSFYVSFLSEKYKTGRQHFLKAFLTGLKSNIKARTSKEYSSHIYILKKST